MTTRAQQMGISSRGSKSSPLFGEHISFKSRDGELWTVFCDSTGYFYPSIDGTQVTSTSYGYAHSVQGALIKALIKLAEEEQS